MLFNIDAAQYLCIECNKKKKRTKTNYEEETHSHRYISSYKKEPLKKYRTEIIIECVYGVYRFTSELHRKHVQ